MDSKDIFFMRKALRLAKRGSGRVHPNPLVGAVLVKKGRVIAEGFHEKFGGPHAEVVAVRRAGSRARGATLYVTLEPCAHFGKTPPCADFILNHGIRKVVIGAPDPNPRVAGKGLRRLKKAGVQVVLGVSAKEAAELNKDYNYWVATGRPYVVAKVGQSLDGKIATRGGQSRWITGPEARAYAHGLRASSDAVLVGVNTIIKDNSLLNVRYGKKGAAPVKIILDSRLRTPADARIFSKASSGAVWLAATARAGRGSRKRLEGKAEILQIRGKRGNVDLRSLLDTLGKRGIVRLLVEGGGEALGSAFSERVVNEAHFIIAPKIIGGADAVSAVEGRGALFLKDCAKLKDAEIKRLGEDWVVRGTVEYVHGNH